MGAMSDANEESMEQEIKDLEERRDQLIDENADLKSQVRFLWMVWRSSDRILVGQSQEMMRLLYGVNFMYKDTICSEFINLRSSETLKILFPIQISQYVNLTFSLKRFIQTYFLSNFFTR